MISDDYRCIFVHIPKNAGASIERIIWPDEKDRTEENLWLGFKNPHHNQYQTGALQHLFASNIRKAVGEIRFKDYYKFTFVRNPWDKVISQYLYLQKRHDLRGFLGVKRHVSFSKYLDVILKNPHVHWQSQVQFILGENGESLVDFIGKFESYEEDVKHVLKTINFPEKSASIPHINKSKRAEYFNYYTDESIQKVAEIYKDDIAYFGYSFDFEAYKKRLKPLDFPTPKNVVQSAIRNFLGK